MSATRWHFCLASLAAVIERLNVCWPRCDVVEKPIDFQFCLCGAREENETLKVRELSHQLCAGVTARGMAPHVSCVVVCVSAIPIDHCSCPSFVVLVEDCGTGYQSRGGVEEAAIENRKKVTFVYGIRASGMGRPPSFHSSLGLASGYSCELCLV